MKEIKLIHSKDIIKLWAKHWWLFLGATILCFALFALLPKIPQTPRYLAQAQVSLEYRKNQILDYDTSSKIAAKYSKFGLSPSVQNSLKDTLPTEDTGLTMSLTPIPYTNLITTNAISTTPVHAILAANGLADYLLSQNKIDEASQEEERYVVEQRAESTQTLLRYHLSTKDKVSYWVMLLFALAMLLIVLEVARSTVATEYEARKLSNLPIAIDIQGLRSPSLASLQTLLKEKDLHSLALLPIGKKDECEKLSTLLKNNLAPVEVLTLPNLTHQPSSISEAKKHETCMLQIRKYKCDYRELQKTVTLCEECGLAILGILIV